MAKFEIKPGDVFNFWTVIGFAGKNKNNMSSFLCKCVCGQQKTIVISGLTLGRSKSCGCKLAELVSKANTKHGNASGGKLSREYRIWTNMKTRCYNPNIKQYKDYGGRGITVCERWLNSFENFLADMGKSHSNKHSIDRKDNNGNYEPGNCKWSTAKEQAKNVRKRTLKINR